MRGFSSYPWEYKANPVGDGIMIKWNSLPGGKLKSNGGSLVHEVGHWLGYVVALYQIFSRIYISNPRLTADFTTLGKMAASAWATKSTTRPQKTP
jgi:hypothetical protein